jgi:hypothetical protein
VVSQTEKEFVYKQLNIFRTTRYRQECRNELLNEPFISVFQILSQFVKPPCDTLLRLFKTFDHYFQTLPILFSGRLINPELDLRSSCVSFTSQSWLCIVTYEGGQCQWAWCMQVHRSNWPILKRALHSPTYSGLCLYPVRCEWSGSPGGPFTRYLGRPRSRPNQDSEEKHTQIQLRLYT